MRTYLRAGLAGVLAFGSLALAVGVAHHNDDAAAASPVISPAKGPYVALGDSYTAGPGIPGQTGKPAGCDRSDHNYPALVAAKLKLGTARFRDMSCSGATIADLTAAQSTDDGTNPAQFSALSDRTRLVTLGISGNDIGFSALIKQCVKVGALFNGLSGSISPDAPCKGQYVSGGGDEIKQRIDAAGVKLATALNEIKRRAPHAQVYVVGYPAILPSEDGSCAREMLLTAGDLTYLYQKEQELNSMLRRRAGDAGAAYVDTFTPSTGRDACSEADTRWVEPLVPLSPAAAVHPNARGERGMADAVLRQPLLQTQ